VRLNEGERRLYADPGRRLVAVLLDSAIIGSGVFFVAIVLRILQAARVWAPAAAVSSPEAAWEALGFLPKTAVILGFLLSLGPLYSVLCESSPWQATLGKRWLDLHVARDDGKPITAGRAFGRWSAKMICGWFWLWLISVITLVLTEKRKTVHDFWTYTVVVRGRPALDSDLEPWRLIIALVVPVVWLLVTFIVTM